MATAKKSKVAAKKSGRTEKKAAPKKKAPETKKTETSAKQSAAKTAAKPVKAAAAPSPRPASKETSTKVIATGPPKLASKDTPAKAAAPSAARSRRAPAPPQPPVRRERPVRTGPPRTVAVTVGSDIGSKLGAKWNCFHCGSKFYDLGKPEPICPRCGADQRTRPKVSATSAPSPPPARRPVRPMVPLLDDEDDGTVRYEEEFDLGVRTEPDEAEEDLFPPGEVEEDDVFSGPEEE